MPLTLAEALDEFAERCEHTPLTIDVQVRSSISDEIISTQPVLVVGVDGEVIRMCREAATLLRGSH